MVMKAAIISYKKKIISSRFTTSSLSSLADNLAEGIQKVKCKDCDCFLECKSVKGNIYCLYCNKRYSNKVDEELKKKFKNTYKFFDNFVDKKRC